MRYIQMYIHVFLFLLRSYLTILGCFATVTEIEGGVYKTLQTKGAAGRKVAGFFSRLISDKPVYNVVELDLNRGESITITCPSSTGGFGTFFPSNLTTYYRAPPSGIRRSNSIHYSKQDLINELLIEGDGLLGLLEEVTSSLILVQYGENSKRLSFLWKGSEVTQSSTLHFICLKEYAFENTFQPLALIVVRVISDQPSITKRIIGLWSSGYAPKEHDVVYTKEYSPTDDLDVYCKSEGGDVGKVDWKLVDSSKFPHSVIVRHTEQGLKLNERWKEKVILIKADVTFDLSQDGPIKVISKDLSSMFNTLEGEFYISCENEGKQSQRVFHLVANTVSFFDLLKPIPREPQEGDDPDDTSISHFDYNVIQGKAVVLYCPSSTHILRPESINSKRNVVFKKEVLLNFPDTRISRRGDSLTVIDFSNTSVQNNVRLQIVCSSRNNNFTSYIFSLTSSLACVFHDNRSLWRPCKVVLFPSEELIVRCPRKSDTEYYGLMPRDGREGYVMVDDSFVKDRHQALSRIVIHRPTGDLHKIKFVGHQNRILMRDEIHYECADSDRSEYTTSEKLPIVIIKLIGNFERVDLQGNVFTKKEDMLVPSDAPKLFHVLLDAGMTRKIDCARFFQGGGSTRLYPSVPWEAFDDIPRFFSGLILSKVKGRNVYGGRALYGLAMSKFPQSNPTSVELTLSVDYKLTSRSDNAMYFLCARHDVWEGKSTEVAVIQVYIPSNTTDLYGSSVEKNLFRLDDEFENSTYNNVTLNILHHPLVVMHCPKRENEINIPQCFDISEGRSATKQKEDNEVTSILDTSDIQKPKSLWIIHTENFRQSYIHGEVNIQCYCLNTDGDVVAKLRLTSISRSYDAMPIVALLVLLVTSISTDRSIF